jgi:hypothetical protein
MDSDSNDTLITALIETVATWTDADKHRLAALLGSQCWPGGILDRRDPGGAATVRRWRPGVPGPPLPACGCARGRCPICN